MGARERQLLLGKYRNLEHELDGAKAECDAAAMRQKYEQEAVAKAEELEMTKMKLAARNTEAEAAIDNLQAKPAQIEKTINEMEGKVDRLSFDLDVSQKETRNASSE